MMDPDTLEYYEYFKGKFEEYQEKGDEIPLTKFGARILLTIFAEISFPKLELSEDESNAHIFTQKLCEAWFAYEALLPAIFEHGHEIEKPAPAQPRVASAANIQAALGMHRNFHVDFQPTGKPSTFDISKIDDAMLEYYMERASDKFSNNIRELLFEHKNAREQLQQYIQYLETNSLGQQRTLLLHAYNAVTNGQRQPTPEEIMSIAYAVRNQYVHAGEVSTSGVEHSTIKTCLMSNCYFFVVEFSLIIATQLIINSTARPPTP